jgi:polyisoprenoid-binding protein YceI
MKTVLRFLAPQLFAAALLAAATPPTIPGQTASFQIDPAQTKVEFTLGDVLHTVHGAFALKRGDLKFDPSSGRASGELVVDAASGDSGSSGRDRRMHQNLLESAKYPEIVFRPDRVAGKIAAEGTSRIQLHGTFTIHGADHELTMPVQVQAANGKYEATAAFVVPYVKWGMKNPSTLFLRVSDHVEITIHTVAQTTP